ncbi:MAG TPA: N-acetylmuramoyl-L-alanine amidase [Cyclobacteriaceae bacterium]|nr:N-acetylmuramoyl-L-alanine amidase [Cyclobacteriaceae bacterium]
MKSIIFTALVIAFLKPVAAQEKYFNVLLKDTALLELAKKGEYPNPVLEISLKKEKVRTSSHPYPIRVAIDPGHSATSFNEAVIEERFIKTKKGSFYESQLTMATALHLKSLLKQAGFEVMLTREEGQTAIGKTFSQWYKKDFKKELNADLKAGKISREKFEELKRADKHDVFHKYFKDKEFWARANKINAFNPDATLIIHYNASEFKNTPKVFCPTVDYNYSVAFVAGGFTTQEMSMENQMEDFIRLATSDELERSITLSSLIVNEFQAKLNSPLLEPKKYQDLWYLKKYATNTEKEGVFGRNLAMTRIIKSPLCYGESLLQNNEVEIQKLLKKDFKIGKIKTSSRVCDVADCYYTGTLKYFDTLGWLRH